MNISSETFWQGVFCGVLIMIIGGFLVITLSKRR